MGRKKDEVSKNRACSNRILSLLSVYPPTLVVVIIVVIDKPN